jgi:ABC-type Fe3+-hydroxamate transport system substrate-binding protein
MKPTRLLFILIAVLLAACSSAASDGDVTKVVITDGTSEKAFSLSDLEKMPVTESIFNEVTYVGVTLSTLLEEAGFSPADLSAVKASASDGYSVNYDPPLFTREDVIVAYATVDGDLTEDDGIFRMVLPGEEGKLNLRFLVELKVIP